MFTFLFCPKLQDKHCREHYDYDWIQNPSFRFSHTIEQIAKFCSHLNLVKHYDATLTESKGVKIDGFLYPNFMKDDFFLILWGVKGRD
jgi:hypothetical protein